jgi:hypothetical protein
LLKISAINHAPRVAAGRQERGLNRSPVDRSALSTAPAPMIMSIRNRHAGPNLPNAHDHFERGRKGGRGRFRTGVGNLGGVSRGRP